MRTHRRAATIMPALLLVVGLAACGDDASDTTASTVAADAAPRNEAVPGLGISGAETAACLAPGIPPDGAAPAVVDLYAAVNDLATSAAVVRQLTSDGPIEWEGEAALALRRFLEDLYEVAEQDRLLLESLGAERIDGTWSFPSDGFYGAGLADASDRVLILQATSLPTLYTAETDEAVTEAMLEICAVVDLFGSALFDLTSETG